MKNSAKTNTKTNVKTLRPRTYILLSLLAAFLLIVTNSAVWFNNYIFDSNNFTKLTTQAIQEESSRTALATEITDRLLENRPALKGVIDEPMIKLTSGLLGSNAAQTALNKTVSQFQIIITSKNPQNVSFDLSSIKQTLSQVLTVAGNLTGKNTENAQVRVEDVPDTITIINVDNLPNIYMLGVVLLWVAPIATLIAAGLLAYLVYRARYSRHVSAVVLAVEGGILFLAGLFALALGPIFKPPLLANVPSENMRVVVENIYQVFIDKFNQQASIIFVLAILLAIAAAVVFWAKPIAARITKK
jgi:hypothetical protein